MSQRQLPPFIRRALDSMTKSRADLMAALNAVADEATARCIEGTIASIDSDYANIQDAYGLR